MFCKTSFALKKSLKYFFFFVAETIVPCIVNSVSNIIFVCFLKALLLSSTALVLALYIPYYLLLNQVNNIIGMCIKIFTFITLSTKTNAKPKSVVSSDISIPKKSSYRSYHIIRSNTDPCGTPLFMGRSLTTFSASKIIYRFDKSNDKLQTSFVLEVA